MTENVPTAKNEDFDALLSRYSRHSEFIGENLIDVSQPGVFGSQIIHLASFVGSAEDVALALNVGADVNAIGDLGLSALHYAVLGGSEGVIELLLELGADLTIENEFGETPRQMAEILGDAGVVEILSRADYFPTGVVDDADVAKNRWLDFRVIQEGNFWIDS